MKQFAKFAALIATSAACWVTAASILLAGLNAESLVNGALACYLAGCIGLAGALIAREAVRV